MPNREPRIANTESRVRESANPESANRESALCAWLHPPPCGTGARAAFSGHDPPGLRIRIRFGIDDAGFMIRSGIRDSGFDQGLGIRDSMIAPVDLLVFGPHPDDIEIGLGGTIAKQTSLGFAVGLCDLTGGEMGSNGTVEQRLAEAEAARDVLGARWRINLRWPDRG